MSPHGYTTEEVTATTLPKRTLGEGLFHIRVKPEQPERRHYGSVVFNGYYEVVPIALHKVRVTPF
jgi:hypothetical protein